MNEYMKFLGMKVKDRVTGFQGVVESVSFDLYGCVQVVVRPETGKDGKQGEAHWFDAKRIDVTSKKPVMAPPAYAALPAGKEIGPASKPVISTIAR